MVYIARLTSGYSSETVEFNCKGSRLAVIRKAKKLLGCTGYRLTFVVESGAHTQHSSPSFDLLITRL